MQETKVIRVLFQSLGEGLTTLLAVLKWPRSLLHGLGKMRSQVPSAKDKERTEREYLGSLVFLSLWGLLIILGWVRPSDSYLFIAFLPYLASRWIGTLRGHVSGQNLLACFSFLLAGWWLQKEAGFIASNDLAELSSVLYSGTLVGLITLGFANMVIFSGLTGGWALFIMLTQFILAPSVPLGIEFLSFGLLVMISGVCFSLMGRRKGDSMVAAGIGFWIGSHSQLLEFTQSPGRDQFVWIMLMSLPLVESLSFFLVKLKTREGHQELSFLYHLQNLGLSRRQVSLYFLGMATYLGLAIMALLEVKEGLAWIKVGTMGATGMALFFGFTYMVHQQRQHHVHSVSQSLLKRYLSLQNSVTLNLDSFQAIVYDLLPYYRNLEKKGIGDVQEFLQDFGGFLEKSHTKKVSLLVGSYTVLIVETRLDPPGRYFSEVTEQYFSFLKSKGLMPVAKPGYFSSRSKREQFLLRFGHLIQEQHEIFEKSHVA